MHESFALIDWSWCLLKRDVTHWSWFGVGIY